MAKVMRETSATEIPGGRDASGLGFDHHLAADSPGALDPMRHLPSSQPLDEPNSIRYRAGDAALDWAAGRPTSKTPRFQVIGNT